MNIAHLYDKSIICGVYRITSPSGKVYIGVSPDIYRRWRKYRHDKAKRQPKLFASFKRHGVDNHIFEIIEVCHEQNIFEREVYHIHKHESFGTKNGLNLTLGGRGSPGCKIKEEHKKQISLRNKNASVPHERRKIISDALKNKYRLHPESHPSVGKKQSEAHIQKRVAKNTGKKHTEKSKVAISNSAIGNKRWLGRKHSASTKLKISGKLKGRPHHWGNNKLVLNLETGIFYNSAAEAARATNFRVNTLTKKLHGRLPNNTSFIYA